MPYRVYTDTQKALDLLTRHGGDVQAARAELLQRWGYAPSISTLITWLSASPERRIQAPEPLGYGITPPGPEDRQDEALKGFEGRKISPLLEGLLEALGNLSDEYVVIVVGKAGRGQ